MTSPATESPKPEPAKPTEEVDPASEDLEKLPTVPTYFVIGDLKTGVTVTSIPQLRWLIDGGKFKESLQVKVQTEFATFPNPQKDGEEASLVPFDEGRTLRVYLKDKPCLKLALGTGTVPEVQIVSMPEMKECAVYFTTGDSSDTVFQAVLLSKHTVSNAPLFPPLVLNKKRLDFSKVGKVSLKEEVAKRLMLWPAPSGEVALACKSLDAGKLDGKFNNRIIKFAQSAQPAQPASASQGEKGSYANLKGPVQIDLTLLKQASEAEVDKLDKELKASSEKLKDAQALIQTDLFLKAGELLLNSLNQEPGTLANYDYFASHSRSHSSLPNREDYVRYLSAVCNRVLDSLNIKRPTSGLSKSSRSGSLGGSRNSTSSNDDPSRSPNTAVTSAVDKIVNDSLKPGCARNLKSVPNRMRSCVSLQDIGHFNAFAEKWAEMFSEMHLETLVPFFEGTFEKRRDEIKSEIETVEKTLEALPKNTGDLGIVRLDMAVNGETLTLITFSDPGKP